MNHLFILFVSSLMCAPAFAVRHVGNGGGEAELRILSMAESLPAWSRACQQNSSLCWGRTVSANLPLLPKMTLSFRDEQIVGPRCSGDQILVEREKIYLADEETPRTNSELADVLIQTLVSCRSDLAPFKGLRVALIPLAKTLGNSGISSLETVSTSVISAIQEKSSLHQQLVTKTTCQKYRVQAAQDRFFEIQCLDKNWKFLVEAQSTPTGIQLVPRYDGNDL